MELRGLGYIGLNATDTKAWSSFAEGLLGLMPSQRRPIVYCTQWIG